MAALLGAVAFKESRTGQLLRASRDDEVAAAFEKLQASQVKIGEALYAQQGAESADSGAESAAPQGDDEDIVDAVPETELWGMRPTHVAETIEELARDCGLPERGLADTLAEYNADAEAGEDRAFGKEARFLKPLKSPYGAYPTGNGMRKGLMGSESMPQGFTLGGLHTDLDSRVLDLAGEPIAGLYAAGRATHGLHGEGYISGTSLGDGSFFGRRAGRNAAKELVHE